jgi:hypothetical protein
VKVIETADPSRWNLRIVSERSAKVNLRSLSHECCRRRERRTRQHHGLDPWWSGANPVIREREVVCGCVVTLGGEDHRRDWVGSRDH